ncbi:CD83 antigen-like isoform X2 [Heterodontus francisci]|uniref:CD83 antigen-like isoform X2 n=1 Tax=Heterodontus francisci TaxID=7792 RepID=UPI00355B907A
MKWGQQELIHQWTVVFLLWLTPAVSSVMTTITAQCTDTATLPCTAMRQERYTYRAVSWYKVIDKTNWIGIIRKTESQIQLYNEFPGSVALAEHNTLIIAHVTAEDAGIYRCSLLAFLGGTNQEGHVSLNVSGFKKNEVSKAGN